MPLPVQVRVKDESLAIAVLGATGDLAIKKLFPTLFGLHHQGFLPPMTVIIGYGRTEYTDTSFRAMLRQSMGEPLEHSGSFNFPSSPPASPGFMSQGATKSHLESFLRTIVYIQSTNNYGGLEGQVNPEHAMAGLVNRLDQHKEEYPDAKAHNRIFYFALPFTVWPHVCKLIKLRCMSDCGFNRLVLEKPFGRDTASAMEVSESLRGNFTEDQLFRVDRYLGKEIMENLLVMRFANRFFSPIWNRENIKNVQIIVKETLDISPQESQYFDSQGIIRDCIQNHILQLMALIAMDKPATLSQEDIRDEKLKVLRCIQEIRAEDIVIAQYTEGHGKRGYKQTVQSFSEDSRTPTFAMMVLRIRNERWDGVPFILKAGKGLNERRSEVRIQLRDVPGDLFAGEQDQGPNEFVLRMQPEEELYMKMTIKKPGLGMDIVASEMQLSENWRNTQLAKCNAGISPRRAYERLIMDIIHGYQSHFVRHDELLAAWKVLTPVLEKIDNGEIEMHSYPYKSRGPSEAESLRQSTGHVASIVAKDHVPLGSCDDLAGLAEGLIKVAV